MSVLGGGGGLRGSCFLAPAEGGLLSSTLMLFEGTTEEVELNRCMLVLAIDECC